MIYNLDRQSLDLDLSSQNFNESKNQTNSFCLQPNSDINLFVIDSFFESADLDFQVLVEKNSVFNIFWICKIYADIQMSWKIELQQNARLNFWQTSLVHNSKLEFELTCSHQADNSFSQFNICNILDKSSSTDTFGNVIIEKQASFCQTDLSIKNLLLDPNSKAFSKPNLEIFNKQTQAKHGATTGFVDTQTSQFLSSRGLDEKSIKQLITTSLVMDTIHNIPVLCQKEKALKLLID